MRPCEKSSFGSVSCPDVDIFLRTTALRAASVMTLNEAEIRESVRETLKRLCEDETVRGRLEDGRVHLARLEMELQSQGIKIPGAEKKPRVLKKFLRSDPYFEITASEHGDLYVQYLTKPREEKAAAFKLRPGERAVLRPAPAGTKRASESVRGTYVKTM